MRVTGEDGACAHPHTDPVWHRADSHKHTYEVPNTPPHHTHHIGLVCCDELMPPLRETLLLETDGGRQQPSRRRDAVVGVTSLQGKHVRGRSRSATFFIPARSVDSGSGRRVVRLLPGRFWDCVRSLEALQHQPYTVGVFPLTLESEKILNMTIIKHLDFENSLRCFYLLTRWFFTCP